MRHLVVATLLLIALPSWAQRLCVGDCGGDGKVTVDEIIVGTQIALGARPVSSCPSLDQDGDGVVRVDVVEMIPAITHALDGCPPETIADAAFWQTLHGEASRDEEAIKLFHQALDLDPGDARSHFLLGMTHLYRFGRGLSGYDSFDDAARQEITLANASLDLAVLHAPENRAYPGFRGAATYMNGVVHADQVLVDLGVERLRASIELWPLFNRFSFLGTVAAVAPAGSALFEEAYGYLLDALSPEGLSGCTGRLCGNEGLAPRNFQGSGILFGDILAKGGDATRARGWYQFAAGSSDWVFAALAQERVDTAAARVALYQDEDPSNDPQLAGLGAQNCAICHYR